MTSAASVYNIPTSRDLINAADNGINSCDNYTFINADYTLVSLVSGHHSMLRGGLNRLKQHHMASPEDEPLLPHVEQESESSKEKPKSYLKDQIVSCLVLVFYIVASITGVPLLSQYIHARYEEIYSNNTNASNPDTSCLASNGSKESDIVLIQIQKATSWEILKITLCSALPPAAINMVVGSYSDHLGRKIIFLLPLFGSLCKYIVICLVVHLHLNLNYLLLGVLLEGCSGGVGTFLLVSLAYAADVTRSSEQRTLGMVLRDSSASIAVAFGQLLTGALIAKFGFFYPCISSIAFLVLATLMVIFGLSETVKGRQGQSLSPFVHMKKVFGFYTDKNNNRCLFILCLMVFSLISISLSGKYSVETLYQLGYPFCWDPLKIGYFGAVSTVILTFSGLVAIRACCVKPEVLAVVGLLLAMGSLTLEGLATNDIMMYAVPFVASISSVCTPVIRSVMSRMAGTEEQGALFSSLAVVDTLCGAIGGSAFSALYSSTLETMRGMVFLVIAGIFLIASVVYLFMIVRFLHHSTFEVLVSQPESEVMENSVSVQNQDTVHPKHM